MLLYPLLYMYLFMWEFHMYPCSNEVLYVNGALLTGKCSGLVGLAVWVHYVCTPQGGSQQVEMSTYGIRMKFNKDDVVKFCQNELEAGV